MKKFILAAVLVLAVPFIARAHEPETPAFVVVSDLPAENWFDFYEAVWDFASPSMSGTTTVQLHHEHHIMRSLFDGAIKRPNGDAPYYGAGVAALDHESGVWNQRFVDAAGEMLDVTYVADGEQLVGQWEAFGEGRRITMRFVFHDITDDSFTATIKFNLNGQGGFTTGNVLKFTRAED